MSRAVEAAGRGLHDPRRSSVWYGAPGQVVEKCGFSDDTVIVNVQGDEPMIPPAIIRQVAENLAQRQVGMATLAVPIHHAEEAFNPNAVKVVMDAKAMRSISPAPPFRGIAIVSPNLVRRSAIPSCVISVFTAIAPVLSAAMLTGRRPLEQYRNAGAAARAVVRRENPLRRKFPVRALIRRKIWSACALKCVNFPS
jgi:hypothetical protein